MNKIIILSEVERLRAENYYLRNLLIDNSEYFSEMFHEQDEMIKFRERGIKEEYKIHLLKVIKLKNTIRRLWSAIENNQLKQNFFNFREEVIRNLND